MIKIIFFLLIFGSAVKGIQRGNYFEFNGQLVDNLSGWVTTERGKVFGFLPPDFQSSKLRTLQRGEIKEIAVRPNDQQIDNPCFRQLTVTAHHFHDKIRIFKVAQQEFHCRSCHDTFSWITHSRIGVETCSDKKLQKLQRHLSQSRRHRRDFLEGSGTDEDFLHYDEEEEEEEDDEDDSEDIDNQVFNTTSRPSSTEGQPFVVTHVTTPRLPDVAEEMDKEMEEVEELMPSERIVLLLPTPSFSGFAGVASVSATPVETSVPPSTPPSERIFSSLAQLPQQPIPFSSSILFQDHLMGSGDGPLEEMTITPSRPTEAYQSPQVYNNNPPQLQKSIQKQALTFGKVFEMKIDPQTFYDVEDGSNLSLSLSPAESWVHFDRKSLQLSALPTIHEVSDWRFELVAVDKDNLSSLPHDVLLSVRQRPKSRNYNHLFTLTFGRLQIHNGLEFKDFYYKICEFLSCDDLVVFEVHREYPFSFSFVNESLAVGGSCPVEDLKKMYKKLTTNHLPSPQLNRHMRPTFKIESVNLHPHPQSPTLCDSAQIQQIKNAESKPATDNYPPSIKNQIDILNATVGRFLIYKVKPDFCYDPEDGDTTRLNLTLLDSERQNVDSNFWLQFDKKNREFFGLPMDGHEGRSSFVLVCSDQRGKSANDALEVKISPRPPANYNSEFSLQFKSVPFTPKNQRKFLEKLATAFNSDLDSIVVKSFSESSGHVLFQWYNASNPTREYEVTELRRILLSNEGPPEKKLVAMFAPDFNLSVGNIVPKGRMLASDTPIHFEKEAEIEEMEDEYNVLGEYSGYLLTYVIPSVLIAIMVLLALIIACLLSRAKSKNIPVPTDEDEKKNFIKKGVPVIFQDELDDDKLIQPEAYGSSRRSKSPSLPPAAVRSSTPQPPEYQPRKYRKDFENQPSYQPPPAIPYQYQQHAFRQQPQQTNPNYGYRNPPPYVPP